MNSDRQVALASQRLGGDDLHLSQLGQAMMGEGSGLEIVRHVGAFAASPASHV
jgi:hypothetical protein